VIIAIQRPVVTKIIKKTKEVNLKVGQKVKVSMFQKFSFLGSLLFYAFPPRRSWFEKGSSLAPAGLSYPCP
jgi:hypothetical protein